VEFNRVCEIVIGDSKQSELLSVKGLRVTFNVHKTKTIMPNTAHIEIYNLSKESRNKIKDMSSFVLLRAGYDQGMGLQDVYKGTVLRSTYQKRPPDTITTIEAQDGIVQVLKRVSIGYPPGTSALRILNDIISSIGVSRKSSSVQLVDRKYSGGFATVGTAMEALNRITRFLGAEWSIQNNEIKIVQAGGSDLMSPPFISASTGMLGSPMKVANVAPAVDLYTMNGARFVPQVSSGGSIQIMIPGWKIKTLLNPQIEPKSKIGVQSNDIPKVTLFTVEVLDHHGDTSSDGPWETEMDVYESKNK
jgi:hypothetical protein